jgi:hypothetical protein
MDGFLFLTAGSKVLWLGMEVSGVLRHGKVGRSA